jgi:DNA-binding NarL/FixJ family response regulator
MKAPVSGPEVEAQMARALTHRNSVKTHVLAVLAKLGVSDRTQARVNAGPLRGKFET